MRTQRHHRLVARHGTVAVFDAVLTGCLVSCHLWDHYQRVQTGAWQDWVRRIDRLIPPGTEVSTFNASLLFAAVYPEAVPWPATSPPNNTGSWPKPAAASDEPPTRITATITTSTSSGSG